VYFTISKEISHFCQKSAVVSAYGLLDINWENRSVLKFLSNSIKRAITSLKAFSENTARNLECTSNDGRENMGQMKSGKAKISNKQHSSTVN
jgi:hypothetical protein